METYRDTDSEGTRTHYKPGVVYTYEVNGQQYSGDRVTIGVHVSATFPGLAKRTAAKYPVGTKVEVHYDPRNPGYSVLHPHSWWHYVPWLVAARMLALAWAVAKGRLG